MGVGEPDPPEDVRYIMRDGGYQWDILISVFASELREQSVFKELLKIIVGLEKRLLALSDDEAELIVDLVSSDLLPMIWNLAWNMSMQI